MVFRAATNAKRRKELVSEVFRKISLNKKKAAGSKGLEPAA
jgi:hypothetical protein